MERTRRLRQFFTNNSLGAKPEGQAASGFLKMASNHSSIVSVTTTSEIWSETGVGKQKKYKATGALVCAPCWAIPRLCADATEAWGPDSTPAGSGSQEPSTVVRVPKNSRKWWKGPGHSRCRATCSIALFLLGGWSAGAVESLLHSGLDIQFVLSMVYWLSVTQIYHPGGFLYFVDKSEFDTTTFKPEIISYTAIYASNQISVTSLQRIRVQSLTVKLPKSSPHYLSMEELSLFLSM